VNELVSDKKRRSGGKGRIIQKGNRIKRREREE
jgi:hypothetical protein